MRILFIGNGNHRFSGARHFGFNTRFYNGLVRAGHCVYFFSDRDEVRQNSPLGIRKIGIRRANERLMKIVGNFQPEAIVIVHSGLISFDTLRAIRAQHPHIRIANLNVDALFSPHNAQVIRKMREVCDAIFMTTGGEALRAFSTSACAFYYLPNVTDTSIDTGRAFAQESLPYDVSCFMHEAQDSPADQAPRIALANGLKAALPEIKTFYRAFNGAPGLYGFDYIKAQGNAAIGLNLSRYIYNGQESSPADRYLYSSDRIAHIMGNGALAMITSEFGLEDLYAADEACFVGDAQDLAEKTRFYLANPVARQAVAEKGWRKAQGDFNETVTMTYVMERLFDAPLSRDYAWPTTPYRPL